MNGPVRPMPPVLGFAAASGTGKTTLIRALLPLLKAHGLRIGVVKHTHHDVEMDRPGKDSYEIRRAGAHQMLLGGRSRWTLVGELDGERDPELHELLARLALEELDLVLVEGFRHTRFPKIELHRAALDRPLLGLDDDSIIAVASDAAPATPRGIPLLDLDDPAAIARFVLARLFPDRIE